MVVSPPQRLSVLIVDDDPDIREIIKEYLSDMNVFSSIIEASNGMEAMGKVNNQDFHLFIIDLQMPKKGGLDLIVTLKNSVKLKSIPHTIAIFSGSIESRDVKEAVLLGVRHILTKPADQDEFQEKVASILRKDLKIKIPPRA